MIGICDAQRISDEWLRETGFKWEQLELQPTKHWVLWVGGAVVEYDDHLSCSDGLGIELAQRSPADGLWYCWIRSDVAGRYARIIHVRLLAFQDEVTGLIASLTGRKFDATNVFYGQLWSPLRADRLREDQNRLDQRINLAWVDRVDAAKNLSDVDKAKRGAELP